MCRSRIPVRSIIHWSLVSTIFSRSAFVNSRGGTYVPTELIFARTRCCGFNTRLKLFTSTDTNSYNSHNNHPRQAQIFHDSVRATSLQSTHAARHPNCGERAEKSECAPDSD